MAHSLASLQSVPVHSVQPTQLEVNLPTPWGWRRLIYRVNPPLKQALPTDCYGYVEDAQLGQLRLMLRDQVLIKLALVNADNRAEFFKVDQQLPRQDELIKLWYQRYLLSQSISANPVSAKSITDNACVAGDSVVLDMYGTSFQHQVWQGLLLHQQALSQQASFPTIKTLSYRTLAAYIGRPTSTRAVANALGANPVAILIPCHQVLRSDGGLGGYRWGMANKEHLLATCF